MSITRLLFAICGVSRGASALWSHTARARKMHTTGRREREKEESNRKREKSIIQKKKKGKILRGNPRALNSGKKAVNDDANISND